MRLVARLRMIAVLVTFAPGFAFAQNTRSASGTAPNNHKRSHGNEAPERYSLQLRSNSDFVEDLHGERRFQSCRGSGETDADKIIET